MTNPLMIGLVAFVLVLAGAFAGWMLRLPQHHLTDETKKLVSVSMTVAATIFALVLWVFILNANNSFILVRGQKNPLSAENFRAPPKLPPYGAGTKIGR